MVMVKEKTGCLCAFFLIIIIIGDIDCCGDSHQVWMIMVNREEHFMGTGNGR